MPEDKVVTVHMRGGTNYVLAENENDRLRLVKKAQREELRKKYLRGITKVIRGADKAASADLRFNENGEPKQLTIDLYSPIDSKRETELNAIIAGWRERGFKVDCYNWAIYGSKCLTLSGKEDIKALQKIARDSLLIA